MIKTFQDQRFVIHNQKIIPGLSPRSLSPSGPASARLHFILSMILSFSQKYTGCNPESAFLPCFQRSGRSPPHNEASNRIFVLEMAWISSVSIVPSSIFPTYPDQFFLRHSRPVIFHCKTENSGFITHGNPYLSIPHTILHPVLLCIFHQRL